MQKLLYTCLVLAALYTLAGCRTSSKVTVSADNMNGEWNIVELNGKMMDPQQTHQVIGFESASRRVFGNAGCNKMMGSFEFGGAPRYMFKFKEVATTRMACPDMSNENALMNILPQIVRFVPQGHKSPVKKLEFFGADNSKLMVLERRK